MGIKHLSPKSEEELEKALENLPALDKFDAGVEMGSLKIIKQGVEEGIDPRIEGDAAIKIACIRGNLNIIKWLFDEGYYKFSSNIHLSKYSRGEYMDIIGMNMTLRFCLEYAIQANQYEVTKYLLDKNVVISDKAYQYAGSSILKIKNLIHQCLINRRNKE